MSDVQARVTVSSELEPPLTLDLRDLGELEDEHVTIDFHCHEGWSRLGQSYRGVALTTLLRLAKAPPEARYVTVASGEYSIVLTRDQAEDPRVLLAFEQDGAPLPGLRLVGPSEWDCFLSVKRVDRIELTRTAQPATGRSIALARIGR